MDCKRSALRTKSIKALLSVRRFAQCKGFCRQIPRTANQVAQKASATTTNHDLKAIKFLFRSAKRDGYIIEDPSEFVESVRKTPEDIRRPFTVSEIRSVIDVADKEWRSLVLFGLYTGQRLADLATLRWDNIDLPRNEIRIRTRKTGKRLSIPIALPLKTHITSLAIGPSGISSSEGGGHSHKPEALWNFI